MAFDEKEGKALARTLLKIPDCRNYEGFSTWIDEMEDIKSPELLGLPANAEQMLLIKHGQHVTDQLLLLQDSVEHESVSSADEAPAAAAGKKRKQARAETKEADDKPAWLLSLGRSVVEWLRVLPSPNDVKPLPKGAELEKAVQNPLFRCLQREYYMAVDLLKMYTRLTVLPWLAGDRALPVLRAGCTRT